MSSFTLARYTKECALQKQLIMTLQCTISLYGHHAGSLHSTGMQNLKVCRNNCILPVMDFMLYMELSMQCNNIIIITIEKNLKTNV